MKEQTAKYILIALLGFSALSFSQVTPMEKAALLDLYNDTNGNQWFSETDTNPFNNWDFTGPVTSAWQGVTVSNGHVTVLDLRSNNLAGFLQQSIGDLNFLYRILLFDNRLTGTIPDALTGILSLTYISLSSNQLTGSIPDNISGLTNLNTLFLGGNQLTGSVPDLSGAPFLNTLSITVNEFHFGDFEQQFNRFTGFGDFRYNIQADVDEVENFEADMGSFIELTTEVRGSQNHYQWYKDGILITNAPDSPSLILTNLQPEDAGIYHATISSDIVIGLTLVRNPITLTIGCTTPLTADEVPDSIACESYTLPGLSANNSFYTEPNAAGNQMYEGDVITESQTIYVFTGRAGCSDASSFTITIDTLESVGTVEDISSCVSYILPPLHAGNYFTQGNGMGEPLFSGDVISSSQTIYIYSQSGSCASETTFNLEIDPSLCETPEEKDQSIFPVFFTPNADGINDLWEKIRDQNNTQGNVYIYDRYGKLLKQLAIGGAWDGTFNGYEMPSADYWYRFVHSVTGEVVTGHFALIR